MKTQKYDYYTFSNIVNLVTLLNSFFFLLIANQKGYLPGILPCITSWKQYIGNKPNKVTYAIAAIMPMSHHDISKKVKRNF